MSSKTEAQKLSDWFATQSRFNHWEALARFTGIDSGTLTHYRKGTRPVTSPAHREALFKATGIVDFKSALPVTTTDHALSNQSEIASTRQLASVLQQYLEQQRMTVKDAASKSNIPLVSFRRYARGAQFPTGNNARKIEQLLQCSLSLPMVPSSYESSAQTKAQKILQLLSALKRELDFFAKGSPANRKELARVVKGRDVGYIMALFKALYNEDEFQRWLYFTSYDLQGE